MSDQFVLLVHAGATLYMVGIIWFVQVVHYPLFSLIGEGQYSDYQKSHITRTGWIVFPGMIPELICAVWIVLYVEDVSRYLAYVGLILVVLLWGLTGVFSVPAHSRLTEGFDYSIWKKLVLTNWSRTIVWSVRGCISLLMLVD